MKKKKPAKPKVEKRVGHSSTFEEKLSDVKSRMGKIVDGQNQRYHLK